MIGTSDPICLVNEWQPKEKKWIVIAQSAVMKNNLNPDFPAVPIRYFFEKSQKLRFEIKDTDKDQPTKLMGSCETSLVKIINKKNGTLEAELKEGKGKIIIHAVIKAKPSVNPMLLDYLKSGW